MRVRHTSLSPLVPCLLLASLLATGCRRHSSVSVSPPTPAPAARGVLPKTATGQVAAAIDLREPELEWRLSLYSVNPQGASDVTAVATAIRALPQSQSFVVLDKDHQQEPTTPFVEVFAPTGIEPPTMEMLQFMGRDLTPAQLETLARSRPMAQLIFVLPGLYSGKLHHEALQLGAAVAEKLGLVVEDPMARLFHSPKSFRSVADSFEGDEPLVFRHIALHAYRHGELIRVVSVGMRKFGLPDLSVENVGQDGTYFALLNLIGQTLQQRHQLDEPGTLHLSVDALTLPKPREVFPVEGTATGRFTVELVEGTKDNGDDDNRLLQVVFPGPSETLQERQQAALTTLFGPRDKVIHLKHDDELERKSAEARKRLLTMKRRWKKGPPSAERLQVKAPFKSAQGTREYMWIEVVSWKGTKLRGLLEGTPEFVHELAAGARVTVEESEVFDYLLTHADGSEEGNETGPLLERLSKQSGQ